MQEKESLVNEMEHKLASNRSKKFLIMLLLFSVLTLLMFTVLNLKEYDIKSTAKTPINFLIGNHFFNYTNCPKNVFSVIVGGRLGNIIWEYLSVVSVAKSYKNLHPYIPEEIYSHLLKVFEKSDIEIFEHIPWQCIRDDHSYFVNKDEKEINQQAFKFQIIYLPKYSVRYNDVLSYGIEFIRKQLKYRQYFVEYSNNFLKKAKSSCRLVNQTNDVVYVGVHYRGGDYMTALNRHYKTFNEPPDYRYYQLAMNYFRSLYSNVIFIFITVDNDWLKTNIKHLNKTNDTFIKPMVLEDHGIYEDLAILSHCNHSIINYGTYGSFGALYSGGKTIAYDLGLEEDYRGYTIVTGISKMLPNWYLCNNTICDIK